MKQYHKLLNDILLHGDYKAPARPNMPGTISLFGYQTSYDLSKGFPLLTTKYMPSKSIIAELLWFMKGITNVAWLIDNGCTVWNDDAYRWFLQQGKPFRVNDPIPGKEEYLEALEVPEIANRAGDLGPIYGKQWRDFGGVDQLVDVIEGLKNNPDGRRHIVSAWNPAELHQMALPPCHTLFQFNMRLMKLQDREAWFERTTGQVMGGNKDSVFKEQILDIEGVPRYFLDCQLYQRSADAFLGVPFNIASYAALTEFVALMIGAAPGRFIHTFGDLHVYDNHHAQVHELLSRDYDKYPLPRLDLDMVTTKSLVIYGRLPYLLERDQINGLIDVLEVGDFKVERYQFYPAIKAQLSVGLETVSKEGW